MFAGNNLEIQFIIFIFGKTIKNKNYETKFYAGCLIGLVSTMFSDNFIAPQMIELKLGNGTKAYVYIT